MRVSRLFSFLANLLAALLGTSVFATWTTTLQGEAIPGWGTGAYPAWSGFILLILAAAILTAISAAKRLQGNSFTIITLFWILLSALALAVASHVVANIRGLAHSQLATQIEPAALVAIFASVALLICGMAVMAARLPSHLLNERGSAHGF